jgi:hypothetical protein
MCVTTFRPRPSPLPLLLVQLANTADDQLSFAEFMAAIETDDINHIAEASSPFSAPASTAASSTLGPSSAAVRPWPDWELVHRARQAGEDETRQARNTAILREAAKGKGRWRGHATTRIGKGTNHGPPDEGAKPQEEGGAASSGRWTPRPEDRMARMGRAVQLAQLIFEENQVTMWSQLPVSPVVDRAFPDIEREIERVVREAVRMKAPDAVVMLIEFLNERALREGRVRPFEGTSHPALLYDDVQSMQWDRLHCEATHAVAQALATTAVAEAFQRIKREENRQLQDQFTGTWGGQGRSGGTMHQPPEWGQAGTVWQGGTRSEALSTVPEHAEEGGMEGQTGARRSGGGTEDRGILQQCIDLMRPSCLLTDRPSLADGSVRLPPPLP